MKKPIEPRCPVKPEKPKEPELIYFEYKEIFPYQYGEFSFSEFVDKLQSLSKTNIENIIVKCDSSSSCYYDGRGKEYDEYQFFSKIEKPKSKKQIKIEAGQYKDALESYEKRLLEYQKNYKKYQKDLLSYSKQIKEYEQWLKEKEIKNLKEKLAKLEST